MNETELGRMIVRLIGDSTSYIRMLTSANVATRSVTQQISAQTQQIEMYQSRIVGFADQVKYTFLSAIGVVSGFGVALGAIQRYASTEELVTSFGTMLKDMEAGEILIKRIQQLAASTPLETSSLAQAAKMLLQAQAVTASEVVPVLRMLGDTASGNAEKLQSMAYAFGQVKNFGRLMGGELMQLTNAGFNPLSEIARTTGKSVGQLRQDMEKGLITFDMVKNAFKTATAEGGQFFNGMENASKTLKGVWSTLMDDVGLTLEVIGKTIVDTFDLKQVIRNLSNFTAEVRKWVNVISDGVSYVKPIIQDFIKQNLEIIITAGNVTAAIIGTIVAFKALGLAIGLTVFVLKLLKVDLIISTLLWIAWKAVVIGVSLALLAVNATVVLFKGIWVGAMAIATAAMWLYNTAVAAGDAVIAAMAATTALSTAGIITETLSVIAATAATWLWNAALLVMDALLSPLALIAAAIAIGLIAAAILVAAVAVGVVAAALYGAWKAGEKLIEVFMSLTPAANGPMAKISEMLNDWKDVISEITRAVQVDFALAWRFVEAYARLGIAQVSALWPPLWEFVKRGSEILWEEVTRQFKESFYKALLDIYDTSIFVLKQIAIDIIQTVTNPFRLVGGGMDEQIAAVGNQLQGKIADNAGKHWQLQMKEAQKQLEDAMRNLDDAGIRAAKKNLDDLRVELGEVEWMTEMDKLFAEMDAKDKFDKLGKQAQDGIGQVTNAAHHASNAIKELKGVLAGSNEGYQRLLEQRDFLEGRNLGPNAIGPTGRLLQVDSKKSENLLAKIEKNTAKPTGVMLNPANI